jgi:predicted nucleic acid-binding protein
MPSLVAADATVVVAALVSWHERHRAAASAIESALARKSLVLPAPVLIESYAILTRLPAEHRLPHPEALDLLRNTFAKTKTPGARNVWSFLRACSVNAIGGSAAYDAQIVTIARDAGAKTLYTFRREELERVAGSGMEVVEPV